MGMWDDSAQSDSGKTELPQSTSLPEVRPAKTRARRTARAKASTANALDCFGKRCGSCANCDPVGFALRMHLLCGLEDTTGYRLTWKKKATPSGRLWWVLGTPELRTDETECGSSPVELVPTPTKADSRNTRNQTAGRKAGAKYHDGMTLSEWRLRMVPTPTATPYGSNQGGAAGRTGPKRPSLRAMVPTPRKTDADGGRGDLIQVLRGNSNSHVKPSRHSPSLQESTGAIGTMALLAFVEWIMGYPRDWLRLESPRTGTQLRLKFRS